MNDTKRFLLDPFDLEVKIRKQLYPRNAISHSFVAIKVNQCYLHLGPNRIFILESMIGKTTLASYENEVSFDEVDTTTDCEVEKQEDSEQYYQDDLRAGAFQFLDSVVNGAVFDPAPYQAVFNKTTLTWRHPQSRALSKVVIFPLPFMEASEFSFDNNDTVNCELLFWL